PMNRRERARLHGGVGAQQAYGAAGGEKHESYGGDDEPRPEGPLGRERRGPLADRPEPRRDLLAVDAKNADRRARREGDDSLDRRPLRGPVRSIRRDDDDVTVGLRSPRALGEHAPALRNALGARVRVEDAVDGSAIGQQPLPAKESHPAPDR